MDIDENDPMYNQFQMNQKIHLQWVSWIAGHTTILPEVDNVVHLHQILNLGRKRKCSQIAGDIDKSDCNRNSGVDTTC
jgi:hypothetical protein